MDPVPKDRSEAVIRKIIRRPAEIPDGLILIPFHRAIAYRKPDGTIASDKARVAGRRVVVRTVGGHRKHGGFFLHESVAPLIADVAGEGLTPYSSRNFLVAGTDENFRVVQKIGVKEERKSFVAVRAKPFAAINSPLIYIDFTIRTRP